MSAARRERIEHALWGLFVADALAMPAHWYYSLANIARDFGGGVSTYHDPPHPHPEAFMVGMTYRPDVAHAQRLGRPYDILHDHARFYDASYSPLEIALTDRESEHGNAVAAADQRYHYHSGLAAGDNTLAAHLVRVLLRTVSEDGGYREESFLRRFIEHMTTPGRNRDPYTEIYLRRWFENYSRGAAPWAAAEHQRSVWSIGSHGGLMRAMVAGLIPTTDYQALGVAMEHHNLTHRSENNLSALALLVPLLRALVDGADPEPTLIAAARNVRVPVVTGEELYEEYRAHGGPGGIPHERMYQLHTALSDAPFDLARLVAERSEAETVRTLFANACYPEHGVPLLFTMALRHHFAPRAALLANANAGGDNVHRGMVLGLLVGAATPVPDDLRSGLRDSSALADEITSFARVVDRSHTD